MTGAAEWPVRRRRMVVGLGVDVFEVARMELALRQGDPDFENALFTPAEIAETRRQRNPATHYAARFALKEAVLKALAIDETCTPHWRAIELRLERGAAPQVILDDPVKTLAARKGVVRIVAALSRARGVVAASAVLES